ncbi:hypothetical protein Syun_007081 [Stephania yunnanensis]|uniref:Uncharacterized protein n=1 Tax=Stephania yunnanensis TaxID=152371 RepID=A0AAP0L0G5_9MAGN
MSPSLAYVSAQLRNMQDYMTQSFNAVETTLRDHGDRLRRIESQRLPVRPKHETISLLVRPSTTVVLKRV